MTKEASELARDYRDDLLDLVRLARKERGLTRHHLCKQTDIADDLLDAVLAKTAHLTLYRLGCLARALGYEFTIVPLEVT